MHEQGRLLIVKANAVPQPPAVFMDTQWKTGEASLSLILSKQCFFWGGGNAFYASLYDLHIRYMASQGSRNNHQLFALPSFAKTFSLALNSGSTMATPEDLRIQEILS